MIDVHSQGPWPASYDISPFGALLFDLDGTLVDTMPLHGQAYAAVFQAMGRPFTMDDYLAHVGPPARIAIKGFARAAGMGDINDEMIARIHREKKFHFKEVLAQKKATPLAAVELLERCVGKLPMALVSSGNREGVDAILAMMGWRNYFEAVISGDDVKHGKPDPEPYVAGAMWLGVSPASCLVFEDAPAGIESGLAAGMSVIDVTQQGVVHRPDRQ